MEEFSLKNKNILVTGASSGIGRSAAIAFAANGANLVLIARDKSKLQETLGVIEKNKGNGMIVPFDLNAVENIEQMFKSVLSDVGTVHGVLHCAASAPLRPLKNTTYKVLNETFMVNFYAFVEITRVFANQKLGEAGGSIVGLSSIAGVAAEAGRLAYAASKGAMDNAVRVIAKELAPRRIRINSIRPAMVDTPLTREYIEFAGEDYIKNYMEQFQPLGLIEPDSVSQLAMYLLSDMSKYITGSSIAIDAGRII